MYCKECGKKISDGAKFCPYCGANLIWKGEETSYSISNPNKKYEQAIRTKSNTLALAILQCCVLLGWILTIINAAVVPAGPGSTALTVIGSLLLEGCGIAEFVLIIITWSRWEAIKKNTGVSHLWATVGYSICMGLNLTFGLIAFYVPNVTVQLAFAILALVTILCDIFISFWLHFRIKATIHK